MNPISTPYCADQRVCFGGIEEAPTPYGDEVRGNSLKLHLSIIYNLQKLEIYKRHVKEMKEILINTFIVDLNQFLIHQMKQTFNIKE